MSEVKLTIAPKVSHYPEFPIQDVESWSPEVNPDPSYDFMIALYLEYVNDYLTVGCWSRAHAMDTESGRYFIDKARAIWKLKGEVNDVLKHANNPHR